MPVPQGGNHGKVYVTRMPPQSRFFGDDLYQWILDNTPFVLLGNGLDFQMGRSLKLGKVPHNRLLMSFSHGFGHHIERFGNPDFCGAGPLSLT